MKVDKRKIIIAITGSSGSIYAKKLLDRLESQKDTLADVDPGREVTVKVRRDKQEFTYNVRVVHRYDY